MKKLLLIDGHSILNRAFYGVPILTNREGLHTNAVYGFVNIMLKALEDEQADYIAVAFDLKAPTFRHKMYGEYKGTRKPMPEELHEQVPVMKELLQAMEILVITLEGYEADDILGTIAKRSQANGFDVSILSGDRDLLQLADKHIKIRLPKTIKGKTEIENYYPEDVFNKYLVTPEEFIDLKALMGDSSDNIPGVPGIGEKTATAIISRYHSIENAYENVQEIAPAKARTNLSEHYDMAVMSKKLATIEINAPVDFNMEDARIDNLFTGKAYDIFVRLELKSLLNRFEVENKSGEFELNITTVSDIDMFVRIAARIKAAGKAGISLAYVRDELIALTVSLDKDNNFYIPCEGFITSDYVCETLKDICETSELYVINLKDKLDYICQDINSRVQDIALMAYLLNPLKSDYAYEDIAEEFLGIHLAGRTELIGKAPLVKAYTDNEAAFIKILVNEAYTANAVYNKLKAALNEAGMQKIYDEIELPLVYVLRSMEREGIRVNKTALKEYGEALSGKIAGLEKAIYNQAGVEFNINSPKQLGEILFDKLGLPSGKKTKTGYSTSADILEKLSDSYPIVKDILEYRTLSKLKSTYADGLADYIRDDERIHSTFNQTITATGRLSSTEPNLQNIPIRMEIGRLIRKVFVPEENYIFVDADYSQIELRLLAHMSGDENLIEAYCEDSDIHRITASKVFHVPLNEVTSTQRSNAKAVNFGIVYGISSYGLSQDLSISRAEAKEYIESYFKTYPGIKIYLDEIVAGAKEKGYAETLYGRRRPVPELSSGNFMQRQFGERIAMNSPIQGTAADIIKIAMIRVYRRLKSEKLNSRLILQIHDELLIETAPGEEQAVRRILSEEMCHAADLKVPLEVDIHSGKDWFEAK
ncbi:MAG: DNA polymerase I [Butyrivibrio sp.]